MNLTQALKVALPELPARTLAQRYPRLHPEIVFREHILDGKPMFRVVVPGEQAFYTFSPADWHVIQLFDGVRSYEEISDLNLEQHNVFYTPEQVREVGSDLESSNFWYKTQQEKNIAWLQKSSAERRKIANQGKKKKWGDLSAILFPAVNPDPFLTWLHKRVWFIYTWWFTLLTLAAFGVMGGIFITHWGEIGQDTLLFYNFKAKTFGDIVQFWLLATAVMCVHEIGHGLTTKHYGARVLSMGFALIYLTPAFYTDTSEGEVKADRYQRIMITVSGVWVELMICTAATVLWWGTPAGTTVHDFAYLVILITGIAVVLINWNPLMKLDGYYILTELLDLVDLKEDSTMFVSAWVKRNIWRLPVEVPYVPKRRRLGYTIYALLSGLYSYSVLYLFAGFVGNIFRNFSPEWAFVPELATAGLIFKGRIRTLFNFMKFVYLDKKDRLIAWFSVRRTLLISGAMLLLLLLPIFHDAVQGRFVLEARDRAIVRAEVPGTVMEVHASEGQPVTSGALLVQLRNLSLQSQFARVSADRDLAAARAASAMLRYTDLGPAVEEKNQLDTQTQNLAAEASGLTLRSPISGVVVTPRVENRLGSYVVAGTELVEVADLNTLRARIYVSEHDLYKLRADASGRLRIDGAFKSWNATVGSIAPAASGIAPGLSDLNKYAGMRAPTFYVVDLLVTNSRDELKPGMIGTARIYGDRRTLFGLIWSEIANFFGRKFW
jgi:putative peptide zinc metalloprotease protein